MKKVWGNIFQKLGQLYSKTLSNVQLVNLPPLRSVPEQTKHNLLKKKMNNARLWYEEFTGLDEVRAAQNRVLEAEARFIGAQDLRRSASSKLTLMQNRLRDIYAELDNTKRGEDRYVILITEELKLLKEERMLAAEFQTYEREEREHFAILSSALKDSHEKERLQAERTKYWSIIGSILGTVLGIIGSSINNTFRMDELRRLLHDAVTKNGEIDPLIKEQLDEILVKLNFAMQDQASFHIVPIQEKETETMLSQQEISSENKLLISLVFVSSILFLINRFSW